MKVLLDENLDHALRNLLGQHEVVTVAYMGWAGLKNGELLRTAEDKGIDVLLTGDRTLDTEQNLQGDVSQSWRCRLSSYLSSKNICQR